MRIDTSWDLTKIGPVKVLRKGDILLSEGEPCTSVPYLLEGKLKVYLILDSGREMTLYTVKPGQVCILGMLSAYTQQPYPAYTVAERKSKVLLIPDTVANELIVKSPAWRNRIFTSLSDTLLATLQVMNEVISKRVDERLAKYLLEREDQGCVNRTHEEIAKDIGTSRVVVSRILKDMERDGLIIIRRGSVILKDRERLRSFIRCY